MSQIDEFLGDRWGHKVAELTALLIPCADHRRAAGVELLLAMMSVGPDEFSAGDFGAAEREMKAAGRARESHFEQRYIEAHSGPHHVAAEVARTLVIQAFRLRSVPWTDEARSQAEDRETARFLRRSRAVLGMPVIESEMTHELGDLSKPIAGLALARYSAAVAALIAHSLGAGQPDPIEELRQLEELIALPRSMAESALGVPGATDEFEPEALKDLRSPREAADRMWFTWAADVVPSWA